MTWNHRIVVRFEEDGTPYFAVHECYYKKNAEIPHTWTQNCTPPLEADIESLKNSLRRMLEACDKPVLVEKDGELFEYLLECDILHDMNRC